MKLLSFAISRKYTNVSIHAKVYVRIILDCLVQMHAATMQATCVKVSF